MATARIVVCSPYGIACTECKELVIAPNRLRYVDRNEVRHLWTCEDCGHEIETSVTLQIDATSETSTVLALVQFREVLLGMLGWRRHQPPAVKREVEVDGGTEG